MKLLAFEPEIIYREILTFFEKINVNVIEGRLKKVYKEKIKTSSI